MRSAHPSNRIIFLSVTKSGHSAIVSTMGNDGLPCHPARRQASELRCGQCRCGVQGTAGGKLPERLMIDLSHSNSQKTISPSGRSRPQYCQSSLRPATESIIGVMIESHLKAGRQDLIPGKDLAYGQSITDACIGWEDSIPLLNKLADSVRCRRSL